MLYKRILIYQFTDDVSIFYTVLCMYLHSFPCRCSHAVPVCCPVACESRRLCLQWSATVTAIGNTSLHGKSKYFMEKPKTSRQNHKPQSKNKNSQRNEILQGKSKTSCKKKPHTGSVQSLKFFKKSWNLQSNFPDLNKVWKREILVWKNGKKSGIGSFRTLVCLHCIWKVWRLNQSHSKVVPV